ncbi:MAG: ATP-binding protein, partial [Casimicrobiaceae bacterium]
VGLSDALAREVAGGVGAANALALRDQAKRTAQLVDKLLEMARLQAGRVELHLDWQSLEELLGSALQALAAPLAGRPIELSLPEDLPLVRCDGVLIERVLVNLLENAAKHTPAGTPIRIAAVTAADVVQVTVEDRGPGLPLGRESAIFDKFTRGASESIVPGIGLGLAICRTIIEAHGGTIWAENRDGGGARFTFTLPAGTPPPIESESDPRVAKAQ